METNLVVLNNCFNGTFITHAQNQKHFDDATNPRVSAYDELMVLNEFANAQFKRLDDFVERAETKSFLFHRFEEEKEDDITWIEVKGAEPIIQ